MTTLVRISLRSPPPQHAATMHFYVPLALHANCNECQITRCCPEFRAAVLIYCFSVKHRADISFLPDESGERSLACTRWWESNKLPAWAAHISIQPSGHHRSVINLSQPFDCSIVRSFFHYKLALCFPTLTRVFLFFVFIANEFSRDVTDERSRRKAPCTSLEAQIVLWFSAPSAPLPPSPRKK